MEQRIEYLGLLILLTFISHSTNLLSQCDARIALKHKALKKHYWETTYSTSDLNSDSLGSPNYLPPYDDVMSPISSPNQNPPYCIYPPLTPFPPSTTIPAPILPIQSPPPPSSISSSPPIITPNPPVSSSPPILTPNPPEFPTPSLPGFEPSPPQFGNSPPSYEPSPPQFGLSPPQFGNSPPSYEPSPPQFGLSPPQFGNSPPSYEPSPPYYVPGPPEFTPGPPIFLPPVIYPPPTVPPPRGGGTGLGLWCVAKPTVPDPIIQEAMNYACASGADCDQIQPNGSCYQPDTLIAHASFAFNSYWQRTKVAGGTCDFGGTGMLITKDPSYDGCHFGIY